MKEYKAIFFDWDGTAVESRKAPVDEVVLPMKRLLKKGVKLAVISGTTIENIAGGRLNEYFDADECSNLFLGLGRGAYNYRYENGKPELLAHRLPEKKELLKIHRVCYEIHEYLLDKYNFPTDIVFSRPNYCKIDLMVENNRGDQLFFQESELETLKGNLGRHGFEGGLLDLVRLAERIGKGHNMELCATSDAKFLEVGISSKSDNVDTLLKHFHEISAIEAKDCSFWGDEFIGLDRGLFGSDSYMLTQRSGEGDFFDVSAARGERPAGVQTVGGGVGRFIEFLKEQGNK